MIIPTKGPVAMFPISSPSPYKAAERGSTTLPTVSELQFDQVNISHEPSFADTFRCEFVSRLVREVRTNHSSSDITRLKNEVQSGTYQSDPATIAAKLLLEEHKRASN